jgi:hypothetical protein
MSNVRDGVELYAMILIGVCLLGGIAITVADLWQQYRDAHSKARDYLRAPHPNLTREPWRETPELGSGRHLRMDYSDIQVEEGEEL